MLWRRFDALLLKGIPFKAFKRLCPSISLFVKFVKLMFILITIVITYKQLENFSKNS